MDNQLTAKRRLVAGLLLIALVLLTFAIRYIELGSAKFVKLQPAAPLAGAISQSLATSAGTPGSLPVEGKDYNINKVQYFNSQEWAVAKVTSVNKTSNGAVIVLHKLNGNYQVVLGPGTAFSINNSIGITNEVIQYLKSQGVVIYASVSTN